MRLGQGTRTFHNALCEGRPKRRDGVPSKREAEQNRTRQTRIVQNHERNPKIKWHVMSPREREKSGVDFVLNNRQMLQVLATNTIIFWRISANGMCAANIIGVFSYEL